MAFTESWDEAFPPNTQQASLGAQDIRETKTDVRERMAAFAVGTLATRQDPEAEFGTATQGVLYFAYDTGELFQWDGAAWKRRSVSLILGDGLITAVASGLVNTYDIQIPADTIKAGYKIVINIALDTDTTPSTNAFSPTFQGVAIATLNFSDVDIVSMVSTGIVASDNTITWHTVGIGNGVVVEHSVNIGFDPTIVSHCKARSDIGAGAGRALGINVIVTGQGE